MTENKRKTIGTIALALGLVVLIFMLVLTALNAVGTDAGLYHSEQVKADILPWAGISDGDLRLLDDGLAGYLSGEGRALEASDADDGSVVRVTVFGQTQPAFNEKEMTHLKDCYDLFALLRKVRSRLIPWAVLLIVGGAYLLQNRRRIRRIAWLSPLVLLVPLGAFAVWAAADFDGAFTFFHRTLFTNDLWLLDPATDLLIRICPASMFMNMGLRIAAWSLAALVGVPLLVTLVTIIWPKGKEDNTWNNKDMRRASGQKQIGFGRTGMR